MKRALLWIASLIALPIAPLFASTIDLLVVYTPASRDANGGKIGVEASIAAAVASANEAYMNSNIPLQLNLVHARPIEYAESGDMGTDLSRLRTSGDGHLDIAHSLRRAYNADMVCLYTHYTSGSTAGIAYVMASNSSAYKESMFSVVWDTYAVSNHTFAHELGHNMGCLHARPESTSGGAYAYSFGHRFAAADDGQQYRTVMAYSPGSRINYFSNPSVNYKGTATGVLSGSAADNAQSITNTAPTIEAYFATISATAIDADDYVWSHDDGRIVIWKMSGNTLQSGNPVPALVPSEWQMKGVADFNADGKVDLLWRRDNGDNLVWYMNGTLLDSTGTLDAVSTVWDIAGVGDFNADSSPDLLWRHGDGRLLVWYMNGVTRTGFDMVDTVPAVWEITGVDDFNGDSKPDILWRHSGDGRVLVWYMDGATIGSHAVVTTLDLAWNISDTLDVNGDNNPDLLLRHTDGRINVQYLTGIILGVNENIGTVSTAWRVVDR